MVTKSAKRILTRTNAAIVCAIVVLTGGAFWWLHDPTVPPAAERGVISTENKASRLTTYRHQLPIALVISAAWDKKLIALNGVTRSYAFGNGNPVDLRIASDQLAAYFARPDPSGILPVGYVNDQTERELLEFVSDPMLNRFIAACERFLPIGDTNNIFSRPFPTVLNMEGLLYIDTNSGRKELDFATLDMMSQYFHILDNPLLPDGELQGWRECLDENEYGAFEQLQVKLSNVFRNYLPQ